MTYFRKITGEKSGYDASHNLYVIPIKQKAVIHVVMASGLDIVIDDPDLVQIQLGDDNDEYAHKHYKGTDIEEKNPIRKVTMTAQLKTGSTWLRGKYKGWDYTEALKVQVVSDANARQVGKTLGQVTPELAAELKQMSLRDAVMRIAEDQMNSTISHTSKGFGVYDVSPDYNWCGAFVHWCWKQAAHIKGMSNPFGPTNASLLSPQKALHYAMKPETPCIALRYAGMDPMEGKREQEYREIGYNGYQLERGDAVLVRDSDTGKWKHVCMVDSVDGDTVRTMDGNQGSPACIKKRKYSLSEKTATGSLKLAFVHVFV